MQKLSLPALRALLPLTLFQASIQEPYTQGQMAKVDCTNKTWHSRGQQADKTRLFSCTAFWFFPCYDQELDTRVVWHVSISISTSPQQFRVHAYAPEFLPTAQPCSKKPAFQEESDFIVITGEQRGKIISQICFLFGGRSRKKLYGLFRRKLVWGNAQRSKLEYRG